MKIRSVTVNNRKREFAVTTASGVAYSLPYSVAQPRPAQDDPVVKIFVDRELANEAFTYLLESGTEGTIHIEQVLEYNEDQRYLAELLIYKLTLEAQRRIIDSELSRRQIARRLNSSVPQLYRLLDPLNTSKSMSQLISLLQILGCEVDVVVRNKNTA